MSKKTEASRLENINPGEETSSGNTDNATLSALEPLRREAKDKLNPLIRPEKREQADLLLDRFILTISERFSGPLAHPSHLAAYEAIIPGSAERLLAMAEGEQGHRHRDDRITARYEFIYSFSGLICGFAIGLGLLAAAVFTAAQGHEIVAGMFVAASAVGMVSSFVRGRSRGHFGQSSRDATLNAREIATTGDRQRHRYDNRMARPRR